MVFRITKLLFLLGLSYLALGQAPSVQSSNILFSNTYCNRTNVAWTNGDGNGRIVIARKGSPVTATPSDNTYYIPRDTFGNAASEISTGQFVVYNGAGNSVIVFGLESNTVYHFAVYEYNGAGSVFSYLTSNEPQDSVLTEWLDADFTIDTPHQCFNVNSFDFSENATQSGSETISFSWNFDDGNTSTAADPSHVYTSSGIYDVSLTATTTGCTHTVVKKDTVVPLPIPSFILNADSPNNDQIQCFYNADGSTNRFSFYNTSSYPVISGATNQNIVNWDLGDGSMSVQNHIRSKSYSLPGQYRINLTIRSTMNGGNHFCVDSTQMIVEVKPRPLDSTLIYFSDTSMCLNQNDFTFENRTGIPGTSMWFFGDGNSAAGDTVQHSYLNAGMYNVRFEIVDTAGCYDEFDDSVEVVPQPNNFFSGLSPYYCQGDPLVSLMPNLTGGQFEGDQVSATNFNPVQLGLNRISYIYQEGNCRDTSTQSVWVMPIPVFDLGNDTSICTGTTLDLTVVQDSSTFTWSNSGGTNMASFGTAGLIWVEKDNGWCSYRDSLNLTVITAPQIDLGSDTTLCGDGIRSVDLTSDEATYTWSDGYPGPIRDITQTGNYSVTVTNKCGSATDDLDITILPYACELYVPNAFSPNGDAYNNVFRPIGQVVVERMIIFNRWGEILVDIPGPNPEWDGTYQGELMPVGTYFFEIIYQDPQGEFALPRSEAGHVYLLY